MARVSQAEAVARAVSIALERHGDTVWVGIDGAGGAGKSTLARRIGAAVPGAVVVSTDEFSGPRIPEWDWGRFADQLVVPLSHGRVGRYQQWDWDLDAGGEWHEVAPGSVVVLEGVSSTRRQVSVDWALTIWVDTPRELRLARALERDGPAMMSRWLGDWVPSEDAYIAEQSPQSRADLVVSGAEPW